MKQQLLVTYIIVGIITVIIDYALLYSLFSLLHINKNIALTVAYLLASSCNFLMHKHYTFKSQGNMTAEAFKFIATNIFYYVLTIIIVNGLLYMGLGMYPAKLISTLFVAINVFFISKYFIYQKNSHVT